MAMTRDESLPADILYNKSLMVAPDFAFKENKFENSTHIICRSHKSVTSPLLLEVPIKAIRVGKYAARKERREGIGGIATSLYRFMSFDYVSTYIKMMIVPLPRRCSPMLIREICPVCRFVLYAAFCVSRCLSRDIYYEQLRDTLRDE